MSDNASVSAQPKSPHRTWHGSFGTRDTPESHSAHIRSSPVRHATLIRAIPGATFRISREGTYLDYGAGEGFDLSAKPQDFLGKRVDEVLPPDVASRTLALINLALTTGQLQQFDYELERDGQLRHFDVRIVPDDYVSVFAVVRDDTERRRAVKTEQELVAHRNQLERLSSQLGITQERERRAIARELHDGVGQLLGLIRGRLGQLRASDTTNHPALPEVCSLLDRAMTQMRSLTVELSSPVMQELGLAAAVESMGEQRARAGEFRFHFESQGAVGCEPDDMCFVLFRSARELLTNVVKHAGAHNVWASLHPRPGGIALTIRDDGCGFEIGDVTHRVGNAGTFGLFSIRQQVAHVGGQFEIDSEPGRGTRAQVLVPVPRLPEAAVPGRSS